MKVSIIIIAAGKSQRWNFSAECVVRSAECGVRSAKWAKKEFYILKNEKSVLYNATFRLINAIQIENINEVVIAYNKDFEKETKDALLFNTLQKELKEKFIFVKGGSTRAESTKNALLTLKNTTSDFIITHDGARPFVSEELVKKLLDDAKTYGATIPYTSLTDSIKIKNGDFVKTNVKKSDAVAIQTPQGYKSEILLSSFTKSYSAAATDDSEIVLNSGYKVHLIEGDKDNIKITTREDVE